MISGTGISIGEFAGPAIGISNTEDSSINGGEGNDSISGTGTGGAIIGFGDGADGTGISNSGGSVISGGKGDDSITGIGRGSRGSGAPFGRTFPAGMGIGISNTQGSYIVGSEGNDSLSGTGIGGAGESTPFGDFNANVGIGIINRGSIAQGRGDDFISGTGNGGIADGTGRSADGTGIVNSGIISLGDGKDTVIGTGISGGVEATGIGILNTDGIICGGGGSDTLTGYGTSIGIQGGTIDGGSGNDYFKARRVDASSNPVSDQGGVIADVLIKGGFGYDTFDVGYGNATINGGWGWDKLILPEFKNDYIITGSSNNYTIKRDEFTLSVLNVEQIVFLGVSS